MKRILLIQLFLNFTIMCCAQVADITLKPGDKAPSLFVQEWLRGDSVSNFEKGHVYVVEFGAVNCPPCRAIAPHLTELSKQYKGKATFVGVHIWENSKRKPEDLSYILQVRNYLTDMGNKIGFSVAVDVPQQTTADTWMRAAGKLSIPTTFIIDRSGHIAWIGSPFAGMDKVLEQVVAGNFDLVAYARQQETLKSKQEEGLLKSGDPAPELIGMKWLKGKPITSFQPRIEDGIYQEQQVYLVGIMTERTSLHERKLIHGLTKMAKEFAGKASIIVIYSEPDINEREIDAFIKELGDKIEFAVAIDTPGRETFRNWVEAAGRKGTTWFTIDQSANITWIGGGASWELEPILKKTVAGQGFTAGAWLENYREVIRNLTLKVNEAWDNGDDKKALKLLDDLIVTYPENQSLTWNKYLRLSHLETPEGKEKAETFLHWMLENMPENYAYWEDLFVFGINDGVVHAAMKHGHNPDLVLEVANRAIKGAETATIAAGLIRKKASFCASFHGKNDVARAKVIIDQALLSPKIIKYGESQLLELKADLLKYRFQFFAGTNDIEANMVLQEALESKLDNIDWSFIITHALENQKTPNYALLFDVIDRYKREVAAAPQEQKPYYNAEIKALEGDIYAAKGRIDKAMNAYQQAVIFIKGTNNEKAITGYTDKLSKFKQKIKSN